MENTHTEEKQTTEQLPPKEVKQAASKRGRRNEAKEGLDDKPSLLDQVRSLSEQDWDRLRLYLYRRDPRINKSGQPHYVSVLRQPIDEQWIKDNHGSGTYSLRLNDNKGTINSQVLEITDVNAPPKVSPAEIIDCPENERAFKIWPELRPGHRKTAEDKVNGGEMSTNGDAAAVGQLSAQLVELSKQIGSAGSDSSKLDVVAKLLSEAQRSIEQERSARDALVTKVLELGKGEPAQTNSEMVALVRELVTLSEKFNRQPTQAQKSSVEQMAELVTLFKEMRSAFSPAESDAPLPVGGDQPWWATLLTSLSPALQGLLAGPLGNLLISKLAGVGPGGLGLGPMVPPSQHSALGPVSASPPTQGTITPSQLTYGPQPTQPPTQPGTQPAPMPTEGGSNASSPQANSQSTPIPESIGTQATSSQSVSRLMQVLYQYGGLLLTALHTGVTGFDFGDHIVGLGMAGIHQLAASQGTDSVMEALRAIPEFWGQIVPVYGEQELRKWIDDFIDYETIIARMEEEAQTGAEKKSRASK